MVDCCRSWIKCPGWGRIRIQGLELVPSPETSVPEKIKIENNSEHAWLDTPVLGREGGKLRQQHRHHQDAGRLREVREADARENTVSSPSHRLERTAAKKRGHEDDSEIEVKIAPKKAKNKEKFNEGGHKAPEIFKNW